MRAVLGSLLCASLFAPAAVSANGPSRQQVRFGITVARKSLWGEARFRFERAVALDPRSAAAFNNLAVACEQQGDFAAARQAYTEALRLKPKDRLIQQNFDLFREADDKRNRRSGAQTKPSR